MNAPHLLPALLDAIACWVDKEVRPVVMKHDHDDLWPAEPVAQTCDMGLFGATIGKDFGGLGLPATTHARIVAHVASYRMAITGIFNSHLIMAAAVERFGTQAQKAQWLPRLAGGEIRGRLALTELNAGTDLQATRTVARRDGDPGSGSGAGDYAINGTKTRISDGIRGSCFALLGETDPKAEPRYRGMSLFIAPKGPAFTVGKQFETLAVRPRRTLRHRGRHGEVFRLGKPPCATGPAPMAGTGRARRGRAMTCSCRPRPGSSR